jgi:hypothetical protein
VFGKSQVKVLGHIVSNGLIKTDPEKVAAIVNWPLPTTAKKLQKFMGTVGYLRQFNEGFPRL